MDIDNDLTAYLTQLQVDTAEGKMSWSQANPTTYMWSTATPFSARITLQRVARPAPPLQGGLLGSGATAALNQLGPPPTSPPPYYILLGHDLTNNTAALRLFINGDNKPWLNPALERLYNEVVDRYAQDSLAFLQAVVPLHQ